MSALALAPAFSLPTTFDPSAAAAVAARWIPAEDWPLVAAEWQALAEQSAPNAFLLPAFALAARAVDTSPGLGAVVVTRDGAWIGFVAGRMHFRGAVFSIWTHDFAPYGLPLVRRGQEEAVLAALFTFLQSRRVAALDWPLLDEGPLAEALRGIAQGHRTFILESYARACLAEAPPQLSKDQRRLARRLADQGGLEQASTAGGYAIDDALTDFLTLEAAGWKGRRGTAFASSEAMRDFFGAAVRALAATGNARIDLMRVAGRPVAAGILFRSGERAWYWKTAYDEAYARFSPGLLISHAIGVNALTMESIRLVDSGAIPGHSMIDRIWPGRMAITHRLVAVEAGDPGWRYATVLTLFRAMIDGKALAKRLLRR